MPNAVSGLLLSVGIMRLGQFVASSLSAEVEIAQSKTARVNLSIVNLVKSLRM